MRGIDRERFVEARERIVLAPEPRQHRRIVRERERHRLTLDRTPHQRLGVVEASLLEAHRAEQVQRLRMVGFEREQFPVRTLRMLQCAVAMRVACTREQPFELRGVGRTAIRRSWRGRRARECRPFPVRCHRVAPG
ncbi:hypothetical protein ABID76_005905 [Burkholderia ambifaria]